jgi:hypothetical protein
MNTLQIAAQIELRAKSRATVLVNESNCDPAGIEAASLVIECKYVCQLPKDYCLFLEY